MNKKVQREHMQKEWDYYYAKYFYKAILRRLFHYRSKVYAGREMIPDNDANELIYKAIDYGEPFVASRFGSTELFTMTSREAKNNKRFAPKDDQRICDLSGFFPNDEKQIDSFCTLMKEIIPYIDLLATWNLPMEEYFISKYMANAKVSGLTCVEPYAFNKPWSAALLGKRVLVIHPFAQSIEKQYQKRKQIYPNSDVLPEFDLIIIKAVQTIAGEVDNRFKNWFEALEYMKTEMKKVEFDIAIIGCGAYGMPLAVEAKKMGKIAIHMGGATQLLFGIKGKRWDTNRSINRLYNDEWIYPLEEEIPAKSMIVENACYWKQMNMHNLFKFARLILGIYIGNNLLFFWTNDIVYDWDSKYT